MATRFEHSGPNVQAAPAPIDLSRLDIRDITESPSSSPASPYAELSYPGVTQSGRPLPVIRRKPTVQERDSLPGDSPNEWSTPSRENSGSSASFRRKPVGSRPSDSQRPQPARTISQNTAESTEITSSASQYAADEAVAAQYGLPSGSNWPLPTEPLTLPVRQLHSRATSEPFQQLSWAPPTVLTSEYIDPLRTPGEEGYNRGTPEPQVYEQLQYHHTWDEPKPKREVKSARNGVEYATLDPRANSARDSMPLLDAAAPQATRERPQSAYALPTSNHSRGRSLTPQGDRSTPSISPARHGRNLSASRNSPDNRNSYVDLLNIPYSQQLAQQNLVVDNANLRTSVGINASLLDTRKTLEMYRANVKKTNDPAIQYEFAVFMVQAVQEAAAAQSSQGANLDATRKGEVLIGAKDRAELLEEARQILQKLADRAYVFAQYYLGDGYFSGLFNKGKEDYERAFPLFVSAGKHGHAESGYRAALCYEFGWGCRKDYPKAVQFYRQSASKNHPGAAVRLGLACLSGDMGLGVREREGIKWLKRATESADQQHNSAPYELGLLHMTGYGDDVFKDESYAAQLFTMAAELGHAEANLRMGEAYEHGSLNCPKDPALSIHFYTGAAQAGLPKAMMALCAWYLVGAEPVLSKDEPEAYEWAKRAASTGYAKAEYAVGYFTEMGIGCRRDPLEANVWYVRAADHGEERATQRLAIIRAAETGDPQANKMKGYGRKDKDHWWRKNEKR